jgi:hypothetical protein
MAAGLPAKTNWAANDVFTSAGVDELAGTVNLLGLSTVTATAAGTTVLTVASHRKQTFTGTTTQTVTLPVVSTLSLGDTFEINNSSTGVVTFQSSGANSVLAMATMTRAVFVCVLITGTTAASWTVATPVTAAGLGVIQTATASGSPTTISFASIPSTYRNLRIEYAEQSGAANCYLHMRFNADTGGNYDCQFVIGSGAAMTVAELFAQTAIRIGRGGGVVAGGIITIPNYKDTTFNKVAVGQIFSKDGTSTTQIFASSSGGTWRNSAAITQIDLVHNGGESFVNGSVFTLYGES